MQQSQNGQQTLPAGQPQGRWHVVVNAEAMRKELVMANRGDSDKRRAGATIAAWLDGQHSDRGRLGWALYETGIGFLVDFARLAEAKTN